MSLMIEYEIEHNFCLETLLYLSMMFTNVRDLTVKSIRNRAHLKKILLSKTLTVQAV